MIQINQIGSINTIAYPSDEEDITSRSLNVLCNKKSESRILDSHQDKIHSANVFYGDKNNINHIIKSTDFITMKENLKCSNIVTNDYESFGRTLVNDDDMTAVENNNICFARHTDTIFKAEI